MLLSPYDSFPLLYLFSIFKQYLLSLLILNTVLSSLNSYNMNPKPKKSSLKGEDVDNVIGRAI